MRFLVLVWLVIAGCGGSDDAGSERMFGESKADCVNRVWGGWSFDELDEGIEYDGELHETDATCGHRIAMALCGYDEPDLSECEGQMAKLDDTDEGDTDEEIDEEIDDDDDDDTDDDTAIDSGF